MIKGMIGNRWVKPTDRVTSYSANGTIISLEDIYESSLTNDYLVDEWAKNKYSKNESKFRLKASTNRYSFITQTSAAKGCEYSVDGTKMYVLGAGAVYAYSLSTAFDVTTATYQYTWTTTGETACTGMHFKPDGTRVFISGTQGDDITWYDLSTPWNLNTATLISQQAVASTGIQGFSINSDGTKLIVVDSTSGLYYIYTMSTAWTPSSIGTATTMVAGTITIPYGIDFNSDGTKVYVLDTTPSTDSYLVVYKLPTPYSWTGATITERISLMELLGGGYPTTGATTALDYFDFKFSSDGQNCLVVGASTIWNIPLPANRDFSFFTQTNKYSYLTASTEGQGTYFKPDGTKMYVTDSLTDYVYQYSLTTAWDISTAGLDRQYRLSTSSVDLTATDIFFKSDGTKMYILGSINDTIYTYTLSTAWDISSATYLNSFYIGYEETNATGLCFDSTGTYMYVVGTQRQQILRYNLLTAWDVTTAQYGAFSHYITSPGFKYSLTLNGSTDYLTGSISAAFGTGDFTIESWVYLNNYTLANPIFAMGPDGTAGTFFFGTQPTTGTVFFQEATTDVLTTTSTVPLSTWTHVAVTRESGKFRIYINGVMSASITPSSLNLLYSNFLIGRGRSTSTNYFAGYMHGLRVVRGTAIYTTDTSFTLPASTPIVVGGTELLTASQSTIVDGGPNSVTLTTNGTPSITTDFSPWSSTVYKSLIANTGNTMYVLNQTTQYVDQYDNNTVPYQFTATSSNYSQYMGAYSKSPADFGISSDGTKFYILDSVTKSVIQYTLSTPWLITSQSYSKYLIVATDELTPTRFTFDSTGTKLYVYGTTRGRVVQYNLTTAWDIDTAKIVSRLLPMPTQNAASLAESSFQEMVFGDNGYKMYLLGNSTDLIWEYTLTEPYDPTTVQRNTTSINTALSTPYGFWINYEGDGKKLITAQGGTTGSGVFYQNTLITANSFGTMWYDNVNSTLTTFGLKDFAMNPTGTKLYALSDVNDTVYTYDTELPWNIGKLTANTSQSLSVTSLETVPSGMHFKPDGSKLYVVGVTSDRVIEYKMQQSWNVATAYADALVLAVDATLNGMYISPDGLNMYLCGGTNDSVYQYSLGTAWETGSARYVRTLSITTKETNITDVKFKPDGTSMFIYGSASDSLHEYTLSTAWDISTATFSQSKSLVAQEATGQAIFFSPDGVYVYMMGSGSDNVNQYTMSTAWNISTATFTRSKSILAQDTLMEGLYFKSDGLKMYTVGSTGDATHEYTLTTAWDISTATLTLTRTIATSGGTQTAPSGIFLSDDGYNMYVCGITPQGVQQFRMSTAWDTSTARIDWFSVVSQTTTSAGLALSNTGTKMYTTAAGIVYEYNLSVPWCVGSAVYNTSFNSVADAGDSLTTTVRFNTDGTEMYLTGTNRDIITKFQLATPWSIATASYKYPPNRFSTLVYDTTGTGMDFKPDGTAFIFTGTANNKIHNFSLSTAWNLQSASFVSSTTLPSAITAPTSCYWANSGNTLVITTATQVATLEVDSAYNTANLYGPRFSVVTQDTATTDLRFSEDGTKMYLPATTTTGKVLQYNLTKPWMVSSAVYYNQVSTTTQDTSPQGISFKPDGTSMYVLGMTSDFVSQYTLSTAWDITTATYASKNLSILAQDTSGAGIHFKPDGTTMYLLGQAQDNIRQYTLSTPWDISTGSLTSSFSILSQEGTSGAMFVHPSGTSVYIVGSTNDTVYQYDFGTAWNVTTLALSKSKSITTQEGTASGLHFSSDGIWMYISGPTSDYVHQYKLSTPWDVSTASYNLQTLSQDTSIQGVKIANNGYSMYTVGATGDAIYQYSLTYPYQVGSYTYINSKSIAAIEAASTGFWMDDNANTVYTIGTTTPLRMGKFTLTANANIGTMLSDNLSLSGQAATMYSLVMNSTNDKMFTLDNAGVLYGYSLANTGMIGSASYVDTLATTASSGNKLSLNSTNNDIYISASEGNVYDYFLPTTNSLIAGAGKNTLYIAGQEATPTSLEISDDGTKFYVMGTANDKIYQYSTVESYGPSNSTNTQSFDYNIYGITLNGAQYIQTSAASSNFDIFGGAFTVRFSFMVNNYTNATQHIIQIGSDANNRTQITIPSTTKKLTISALSGGVTTTVTIPVPIVTGQWYHVAWQANGIYVNGVWYTTTGLTHATGINNYVMLGWQILGGGVADYFNGYIYNLEILKGQNYYSSNFYVGDTYGWHNDKYYTKSANTVFLVGQSTTNRTSIVDASNTAATLTGATTALLQMVGGSPVGFRFGNSGTKLYILDNETDLVIEYDLTEAWNVATASLTYSTINDGLAAHAYPVNDLREPSPGGIFFGDGGTKVYIVGTGGGWKVHQLDLSTAYDLTTISSVEKRTDISAQIKEASGVKIDPTGTKMFVCGTDANSTLGVVYSYTLSTPWDVSTANVSDSLVVNTLEATPTDISLRQDGTYLYVLGTTGADITEYKLGTPWVLSTATSIRDLKLYTVMSSNTQTNLLQITTPQSMQFMENGNYLYVVGSTTSNNAFDVMQHRSLNTTYATGLGDGVTTVGIDKSVESGTISGTYIHPESQKMWTVDTTNAKIYEYDGR